MEQKIRFGMSSEEKARLLQSVKRKTHDEPTRSLTRSIPKEYTCFDTLACYTQVQVEKAIAQKLGVEQPYYQCHDGISQEYATIAGKLYSNFSCYDYLGLNNDKRVHEACKDALAKYGVSASASRLTAGERPPHRMLEKALAKLHGTEDCISYVSGHATNVSTIAALFGSKDVIFYDQASHNSLVMGASLAQSARFSYPNNDTKALRSLLQTHRHNFQRALIVTEGLFGMDGSITNLPELIALKKEFSCFLMVDEAHSIGTVGASGKGVGEHFHVNPSDVDIWMGTLSKTFCGCGGYIAGSAALIEIIQYHASGFVYSVGMPPMLAASALCALNCMLAEPWRVSKLQEKSKRMLLLAKEAGLDTGVAQGYAVIPIIVGDSLTAVALSQLLKDNGILALPIIYPGVAEGRARLRFFVSASHSDEQITTAINTTAALLPKARLQAEAFAG